MLQKVIRGYSSFIYMRFNRLLFIFVFSGLAGCSEQKSSRPVYRDEPFLQDYSVRYYSRDSSLALKRLVVDRNGVATVLGTERIFRLHAGEFQFPGTLEPDRSYRPMADKAIRDMSVYDGHLVFLDKETVFSNAFAGKMNYPHGMADASLLCMGEDSVFVVSDGRSVRQFRGRQLVSETASAGSPVIKIEYDRYGKQFMILTPGAVSILKAGEQSAATVFNMEGLTCADADDKSIYLGTKEGYCVLDAATFQVTTPLFDALPVKSISAISKINGNLWFGSEQGAFMLKDDGRFNYYYGERWLPSNMVKDIKAGPEGSVMLLTSAGVGDIRFEYMTLEEKALRYEAQVRQRHIRYGFNCDVVTLKNGDLSSFEMGPRESDNLWTSMYLVSQLFRYKVTGDEEARRNYMESFEAMERLFEITGMDGYFARSFDRHGYHPFLRGDGKPSGWTQASDPAWDWKGTTSSDQTVGQMFCLTMLAELTDGETKARAIGLMDRLMTNIIRNDWYLIDFDGKPTLWGKWNPEYVNGFAVNVGDRKLYSSNIIGFLQTAYHFTGKPVYKEKAEELMNKHGYLENLLRPFSGIGKSPEGTDEWAAMLSQRWNHSDDEMYFLAYWCLYTYAFTPELREKYREAIKDHWEAERPEKNSLWNLCYAMTGAGNFDLDESAWHLKEFPLDMIEWAVANSHRGDIETIAPNFRGQTTAEVLPPDERPELKHNRNLFTLDRKSNGMAEQSAGDSFLLPYWMGRYLGVIGSPEAR